MSDKPILFNADMVKALLDGRKTQTRRIIKDHKIIRISNRREFAIAGPHQLSMKETPGIFYVVLEDSSLVGLPCSHGQPGDLLWVRETTIDVESHGYAGPIYVASDAGVAALSFGLGFEDDYTEAEPYDIKQRPSIFMYRWMSRLTLKITDIRIERVQDITDEDAEKEGIFNADGLHLYNCGNTVFHADQECHCGENYPYEEFHKLWDSINKKRGYGWDVNPWVWVIEFKVIQMNIDEYLKKSV